MDAGGPRVRCISCGGLVPGIDGPVHRYMDSSPGCWKLYGEVLVREYGDAGLATRHLTVDAYAVQHPGRPSRQSNQSVAVHLIGLLLALERGVAPEAATRLVQVTVQARRRFPRLEPPESLGDVTVADVHPAAGPEEHDRRVRAWAASAWAAWSIHHGTVSRWLPS